MTRMEETGVVAQLKEAIRASGRTLGDIGREAACGYGQHQDVPGRGFFECHLVSASLPLAVPGPRRLPLPGGAPCKRD